MDENGRQDLPGNVDENVQAIARLHAAHARSATRGERMVERLVALLGRPAFAVVLTLLVAAWIDTNLWLGRSGHAFDPPPFYLLDVILALMAVYMTVVILIVQRRAQLLGDHREQLMLQLSILNDQKTAKLISLIEELRRDDPSIRNRRDDHANELTRPANPEAMLEVIRDSHERQPEQEVLDDLG
jgi:uncharacterized membrane protein